MANNPGILSEWIKRRHPLARCIDSRVRADWVIRRAAINGAQRYCYFRLPKCANSTVIKTLFRYDPSLALEADPADVRLMKKLFSGLFGVWSPSPRKLATSHFCFTIVRNPFTRVLSAYLDKIAAAAPGQYDYVARSAGVPQAADVSFAEFVTFLENGGLYLNPHWAPQTALLPVKPEWLGFIGRVEDLEADLGHLVDRLFGQEVFEGVVTRYDRQRGSDTRSEDFYDDDLLYRIFCLYRADFEAFGYGRNLG